MSNPDRPDIWSRAVQGSFYSVGASGITAVLGFIRAVLLARLLLPEHFGVAAMALFFLNLTAQLRSFGTSPALVHRQDVDDRVLGTYFSLHVGLVVASLLILAALTPLLGRLYAHMPLLGAVLASLIAIEVVRGFNQVGTTILTKELSFRRLATIDVACSATMTVVAPLMAWYGAGVWALVGEQASAVAARAVLLWIVYRPWKAKPAWDRDVVRWFWGYGRSVWKGSNFAFLNDRFGDFWIGTVLGTVPLGYYSRAREFANYPRRVVANPLTSVFFPVFARLQSDTEELSRSFFRMTALIVRAGFGLAILLIATAPEFVGLILGERWQPMTPAFQLLILYALLDPLASGCGTLLGAIGYPNLVARVRMIQFFVFVPAVIGLAHVAGITGVAIAADLMMLIGTVILFSYARRFVTYPGRALWMWPVAAAAVAAAGVLTAGMFMPDVSRWIIFFSKIGLVVLLYGGVLWLTERRQIAGQWRHAWRIMRSPVVRSMR